MDTTLSDPLVGRVVDGRYAVTSRIARGGMATVYLATDNRLDREVALKVMHPHLAEDAQFIARFHREAKSAAQMSHPSVVAVYDQGSDGGAVYLAMEHVPGSTLRDLITARGALTPREALAILDPVLDALGAAHRVGIVHRDIKPENVLLTEDGRVKVADFGLARAASAAQSGTTTGMLMGTVAYLSPELVLRGVADARSDVYAAGIVLFEMLTGAQPFTGDVPIQVAYQHVHDDVPAPSSLEEGLSPELDELVLWATARDPDDRPADARELFAELRRLRATLPDDVLDRTPAMLASPRPDDDHDATVVVRTRPGSPSSAGHTLALRRPVGPTPPAPPEPRGRRRRRGLVAVVAMLVVAALVAAGGWFFLAGPGAYTTTPDVVGQQVVEAERLLAAQGLDSKRSERFDEQAPVGQVLGTRPGKGEQVRKGGTVELFVSRGSAFVAVPSVVGQTRDEATTTLTGADLTVGDVTEEFSEKVEAGRVISQGQPEGTKLRRGEAVPLTVSKGREPIAVPSVVGKTKDAAVAAVNGAGLKPAVTEEFSETVPLGTVISQSPTEGTLFRGDTVALVVSKGPPLVQVPNVMGKQLGQATQTLNAAGFDVRVEKILGGYFDTVRDQNPKAGTQAPRGSTVTLTVV